MENGFKGYKGPSEPPLKCSNYNYSHYNNCGLIVLPSPVPETHTFNFDFGFFAFDVLNVLNN